MPKRGASVADSTAANTVVQSVNRIAEPVYRRGSPFDESSQRMPTAPCSPKPAIDAQIATTMKNDTTSPYWAGVSCRVRIGSSKNGTPAANRFAPP